MGHTKTSERKKDHIDLAFKSIESMNDGRFYYEPLFEPHPHTQLDPTDFNRRSMLAPLWISSMTGGTKEAHTINLNLAKAVGEFGLGMGLGSCRIILDDNRYLKDFQLRSHVGDQPLYANLGIVQLEDLLAEGKTQLITELIKKTETDGLIVHVNPLQEWLQPEGDTVKEPPIQTIERLLDLDIAIIVKEVGQGFGPKSLSALMKLPVTAIDFAAHGGTNFSKLELHRSEAMRHEVYDEVARWGHDADEMVEFYNKLNEELGVLNQTQQVIVSGGVRSFVDGYYYINKIQAKAVYGQASAFLKHARGEYEELQDYVRMQIKGLELANTYLTLK